MAQGSVQYHLTLHGKRFIGGFRSRSGGTGKTYASNGGRESERRAKRLAQKEMELDHGK